MSSDSDFASFPNSDAHPQSLPTTGGASSSSSSSPAAAAASPPRHWRDVFWLIIFLLHLLALALVLGFLGLNRFRKPDRLNIDRFTNITAAAPSSSSIQFGALTSGNGLTETFWPLYGAAGAVGTTIALAWLVLLGSRAQQMMKVSVHSLTTYLAVISVLCFWGKHFFWGVAFAVGAGLQFMYVMSVMDRYVP